MKCFTELSASLAGRGVALALIVMLTPSLASAKVTPFAQYNLAGQIGIRDMAAPSVLKNRVAGAPDLTGHGTPKIMSDGPASRRKVYDSSIKFESPDQVYSVNKNLLNGDNFVVEAWAYALKADDGGFHTVVASGTGDSGFLLSQYNNHWDVLVSGVRDVVLAPIQPNTWTHLAIVKDNGVVSAWINGKKICTLPNLNKGPENFAIGATSPGKESFNGWIAEVRCSSFLPGQFDPITDFLIDQQQQRADYAAATAGQIKLIDSLIHTPGTQVVTQFDEHATQADWLINPPATHASVQVLADDKKQSAQIMISNGIISRTFLVSDNLACISMRRSDKDLEFIRAVKPEVRFRLNGGDWTEVGGLTGAPEQSYIIPEWLKILETKPNAFRFTGMTVEEPVKPYEWKPKCNALPMPWPAKGQRVTFHFVPPPDSSGPLANVLVDVHYEIYDGLPVMMKTFTVTNKSTDKVVVTEINGEFLAVLQDGVPLMHVESDYSFALANATLQSSSGAEDSKPDLQRYYAGGGSTLWEQDPEYRSQATLNQAEDVFLHNPGRCLLISRPPTGPSYTLPPNEAFQAMRTFEILNDTNEKERSFLAQRRFYNTLAPQTTENQLGLNTGSHDVNQLKRSIDQMVDVGFERLQIDPPGIGYDDVSPGNISWLKEICDYGKSKGIRLGAYELLMASRDRGPTNDVIDPVSGKPGSVFGQSGCGCSEWGEAYRTKMFQLIEATGLGSFDPDGPYHGDPCASHDHPGHKGLEDSQWMQWKWMCDIFHECERRGLYCTAPDWYFLNGLACTGMGYRESSDGLPIELQNLVHRQYIYDATYHKTAGMGWMNLHIGTLHGGPEKDLHKYETGLFQMLSYGCEPWVDGDILYDGPKSEAMVRQMVAWYKKYYEVIRGDLIHLRRPDGRGLDYVMHVRPGNKEKGMLLIFNPTSKPIEQTLNVPLYYTGLTDMASIREQEGTPKTYKLDREFKVSLPVSIPAEGYTWMVIE
jgi:hypothetical protein